ncbi:MAG: sigma factor-like helix-turn-helix DNA-binding protein, partial [Hyphomicrobiales bacterium]
TAADRSDLRALLACLDQLADGPRRAILAAYLDGASGEEIASRLKTPIGTIKSWIHRGLAAVRECLGR